MSKNKISVNKNINTITETYSVNSRGREIVVTQSKNVMPVARVLIVLLCLLLVAVLIGMLENANRVYTLQGMLEYMSNAPDVSSVFSPQNVFSLASDWGPFNFLLPIWNGVIVLLNFFITMFLLVIKSLDFVFYFIRFFI